MSVKPVGTVPAEKVPKAIETEIEWLIDRKDGAPNFELRKFKIRANGKIPRHFHPDIEHEQYVLKGEYLVGIGDRVYQVRPGDSLFIPAGTLHWYENLGKEDVEFLCIIPKKDGYEAIYTDEIVESAQVTLGESANKAVNLGVNKEC